MNRQKIKLCGLLVIVTWMFYFPVRNCDFINYDDPAYVAANPMVQKGITKEGVMWAFGRIHGAHTYWHPVTWLSHMTDCELFGLNPRAHHLTNLAIHSLNVSMLFLVLTLSTGSTWRSLVVAGLFGLHPLQVDSVAWVTERKNLLSGMFCMLVLLAYIQYVRKKQKKALFYIGCLSFYGLGLMSKPVLVTLPCLLLLFDVWPLGRIETSETLNAGLESQRKFWMAHKSLLLEKIPFFLLAAASSMMTLMGHQEMGALNTAELSFMLRVENGLVSYVRYLGKTLWPTNLSILYPHPLTWPPIWVISSGGILIIISVMCLRAFPKRPFLTIGWFWFLGVLVPTIGFVQAGVQAMADRFMYIPLIGLLLLFVWGFGDIIKRWNLPAWFGSAISLAALYGSGAITRSQLGYWESSITLFKHATEVTVNNYRMHANLAAELLRMGQNAEANQHVLAALRIEPNYFPARYLLGVLKESAGDNNGAEQEYEAVLRHEDDGSGVISETHAHLAGILVSNGRAKEGIEHYRFALKGGMETPELLNNLAWVLVSQSSETLRNGTEASHLAELSCSLTHQTNALYLGTLAAAYAEANRFEDALTTVQKAIGVANNLGEKELAKRNQQLLELYRAGKRVVDEQR